MHTCQRCGLVKVRQKYCVACRPVVHLEQARRYYIDVSGPRRTLERRKRREALRKKAK